MCETDDAYDFAALSKELVRALRGRRSQKHLSKILGYRSNVVFDWEAGRRFPTAARLLQTARRSGVDVAGAVEGFARPSGHWPESIDPCSPKGVVFLLGTLRGRTAVSEIARLTGCSRFAIGRWLKGQAEPRLPDFLRLVQATSLRLLEFLATLTDPATLPSVRDAWQEVTLARKLAYYAPWSHAVLRLLETDEYRRQERHLRGYIAEKLGISGEEEDRCLELLEQAGQIRRERGAWRVTESRTVDTRLNAERSRRLKAFWVDLAAKRLADGYDGEFAFNLFSVSLEDLERLVNLQRSYFAELRNIVVHSEPAECVVLTNIHLLPLAMPSQGGAAQSRRRLPGANVP